MFYFCSFSGGRNTDPADNCFGYRSEHYGKRRNGGSLENPKTNAPPIAEPQHLVLAQTQIEKIAILFRKGGGEGVGRKLEKQPRRLFTGNSIA
jgi:hypothetical protein